MVRKILLVVIPASLYFFSHFHRVNMNVIADNLMNDFFASATLVGLLSSMYFYFYAFIQIPIGTLNDTIGPGKTMFLFSTLSIIGVIIFALSTNIYMAMMGRILIGIGVGAPWVSGLKLFSEWIKEENYASVSGALASSGYLGAIAATIPFAYMVLLLGWRTALILIAIIMIIPTLICWLIARPARSRKDEKKALMSLADIKHVIRDKSFLLLNFWMIFNYSSSMVYQGIWGIPYIMQVYGLDKASASGIVMLAPISGLICAPLFGLISDRILHDRKKVIVFATILNITSWTLLTSRTDSLSLFELYLTSALTGASISAIPISFTIIRENYPSRIYGTISGVYNMLPFISAALYQPITGYILDSFKHEGIYPIQAYRFMYLFLLISSIIALISSTLIKTRKRINSHSD
ncbi:MAG: MFS transporter [Candidatus Methanomethylicia archaeon]